MAVLSLCETTDVLS